MPAKTLKFRTKINIVAGLGIAIGLAFSVTIALYGMRLLNTESSDQIERGLGNASKEYMRNRLTEAAYQTNDLLAWPGSDLTIFAAQVQGLVDRREELAPVHKLVASLPGFADRMTYNKKGNWYQNQKDEPTYVATWGYLLDKPAQPGADPTIRADVKQAIAETALFDVLMPPFQQKGTGKLQFYFVGPEQRPYMRLTPWGEAAAGADKKYPDHNKTPFWSFFFPKLVDGWKAWAAKGLAARPSVPKVTVIPPYDDAGGGGLVMTFFHPVWSKGREAFAGAVGLDMTLKQMVEYIKEIKLFRTGFAFLAQSDGNVLVTHAAGEKVLRLKSGTNASGEGVDVLHRNLKDSADPAVAGLALPRNDIVHYEEVFIGGKKHVLVMKRLFPQNLWSPKTGIGPDHWTLGFVVPSREIYASLYSSQKTMQESTQSIARNQIVVGLGTLLLVVLGVTVVTRRMTATLAALAAGANKIIKKDYDVRVPVNTGDEIGRAGQAFNAMAAEIRAHTENLEGMVLQRTHQLEDANRKISALNDRLKEENLRMGAELDVARRLQLMVLPPAAELERVDGLDIAAHMQPAYEVGGDYYDVLQGSDRVKIGIGDVTGHGLESGVLMLMIQTAVRTLLTSGERDPRRFLDILNRVIYENIQRSNLDLSMTLSLLDYADGSVVLTGQHEEVLVVRKDGAMERIDTLDLGFPLGLDLDISEFIAQVTVPLSAGDVLVLYTDGITEAEDSQKRQYGTERLCQLITRLHDEPSEAIRQAVIDDVLAHIGDATVYDDITLVVIKQR